jgi:CheY-like chemotaxis protein
VFTIHLPAVDRAQLEAAMAEPAVLHGRGRILIMDDEESVRQIAGKIVQALGYDVAFACEGQEAVERWRQARTAGQPFDLVIMDLTIPGGRGGREAIRELLALDPAAKAVVSSGYCQDPVMANHRKYGFVDVLAKPYSVADMGRVLATILRPG